MTSRYSHMSLDTHIRRTAQSTTQKANDDHPPREWSGFEMQAVQALLCKRIHLEKTNDPVLRFTTVLNEVINGKPEDRTNDKFVEDLDPRDVEDLLKWVYKEKKAALSFIERQKTPYCLTRVAKNLFNRKLPFDGTKEEWAEGRREEEARRRPPSPCYSNNAYYHNTTDNYDSYRPNHEYTPRSMFWGFVGGYSPRSPSSEEVGGTSQPRTPIGSEIGGSSAAKPPTSSGHDGRRGGEGGADESPAADRAARIKRNGANGSGWEH